MSDKKAKKLDYVVVKPGVADHKVGDTVKLTERTGAALQGRVVLKSEYNTAPAQDAKADTKELDALKKQVETLEAEKAALGEQVETLEAEKAALGEQVATLEAEKAALETAMGGGVE